MLPRGIPSHREDWPAGLLDHLRKFRQGHIVTNIPVFYWGDPVNPVFALTREYTDQGEGLCALTLPYGLITTQTCDIAEEDSNRPTRPWVQVAPVYDAEEKGPDGSHTLHGGERKLVTQGRVQHLLHVPELADGLWVADLRILLPIEKGWLQNRQPVVGFATEPARHEVGRRLAFLHRRPAFDPAFVEIVQQPLVTSLRVLASAGGDLIDRLHDQVLEVGVRCETNIDMGFAEVWVLSDVTIDSECVEWFQEQWDGWYAKAQTAGFRLLPLQIARLDELNAATYRALTTVPLANISPATEWYSPDPYEVPMSEPPNHVGEATSGSIGHPVEER